MESTNLIHGIKYELVENKNQISDFLTEISCPVCLNIILDGIECKTCKTSICSNCLLTLRSTGSQCIYECQAGYGLCNKYLNSMLETIVLTCEYCSQRSIPYGSYMNHLKKCQSYLSNTTAKLIIQIREIQEEKERRKEDIKQFIKNQKLNTINGLITDHLSVEEKGKYFKLIKEGNLTEIKNKKWSLTEDLKPSVDKNLTPLTVSFYYGKHDIIKYFMDNLKRQNVMDLVLLIESEKSKLTPMKALLLSTQITEEAKKEIFKDICNSYQLNLDNEIKKILQQKNLEEFLLLLNYPY